MLAFLMAIENEEVRNKLEEIYKKYHRDMYITAYSILKDHHRAEDVVQDVVLRITKNLHKISNIECKKTRSYLVVIVRNLSFNSYNKQKEIALFDHERFKRMPDEDEMLIEEELIKMEMSFEMAKYLARLHPTYIDILTLRFYYDLEISEIAKTINITENNVSVRINRALAALEKVLKEPDKQGRCSRFAKQNSQEKEGVNCEQTV